MYPFYFADAVVSIRRGKFDISVCEVQK